MTTKKKIAILTTLSTRNFPRLGSISGARSGRARGALPRRSERRAEIAQRPVRQSRKRGDLRRRLLEDRAGRGVLAAQAEAVPQVAQDAPHRVRLATRPETGAQALHPSLEIDHRPLELPVAARRQRHVGAIDRRALPPVDDDQGLQLLVQAL